ncbi:MAG: GNAT family N-acetyltransferase [Alphaproteobacteria bacterium]|nr:GNAT family N-acetyltransferase [Alphaproteobacteria bacterium]
MSIDLSQYETQVRVRPLTLDDYEAVVALQRVCFPLQLGLWTREEFNSQVRTFPEGQLCVEYEGRVVASSASLILSYEDYSEWHDWENVSANGMITNHDPGGDTLYGIEIQVHPEFRGRRLARRLYEARKEICQRRGLARILIGGRIPGYAAHQHEMSASEYAEAVREKRLYDPVLSAQLSNGFVLRQLIEDYYPSDEDSSGYATHLEWVNLDYVPKGARAHRRRRVNRVMLGMVQYMMRPITSWEQFAQQVEFFVDTASDWGLDILVFPELFTLQLLTLVTGRPSESARQLAAFTPRYLELFTELAIKYRVNIVAGSQLTLEDDHLFNVAYLFRRDGTIGRQKKIHPTPNEARHWGIQGGDQVEVFDTDVGKVAVLICYDIEFPELARIVAERGAHLILVPYNTADRYGHVRVNTCARARCIENHVFVATAGCVGNLPFVDNADIHFAQSGVYTPADVGFPWDGVAAEAAAGVETIVVQEVDTELARRHRADGSTLNWQDRRRDLYRVLWRGEEEI